MQELADCIKKEVEQREFKLREIMVFTDAAAVWATYALHNHAGGLLDKALNISKALVAYEDALFPHEKP